MMNKEEMKMKKEALNAKMKEFEEKAKDVIDTAKIQGMYTKDKINEMILEAKSQVNAMKENYVIFSERAKGKASSELLKAKMNIDVAKKELADKKEEHDKNALASYIDEVLDYASACLELSMLAREEARLAALEAAAAEKEYEEKYGSEE